MKNKAQFAALGMFGIGLGVAAWALGKFFDKSDTLPSEKVLGETNNLDNPKKDLGKPKNDLTDEIFSDNETNNQMVGPPEAKINGPAEVGEAVETDN